MKNQKETNTRLLGCHKIPGLMFFGGIHRGCLTAVLSVVPKKENMGCVLKSDQSVGPRSNVPF